MLGLIPVENFIILSPNNDMNDGANKGAWPLLFGDVLAVANWFKDIEGALIEPNIHVGDIVLFDAAKGDDFRYAGEKLILIKRENVFAILKA